MTNGALPSPEVAVSPIWGTFSWGTWINSSVHCGYGCSRGGRAAPAREPKHADRIDPATTINAIGSHFDIDARGIPLGRETAGEGYAASFNPFIGAAAKAAWEAGRKDQTAWLRSIRELARPA